MERLKRDENGSYPGSLSEGLLTAEQQDAARRTLAEEGAMSVTALAQKIGINIYQQPHSVEALSRWIGLTLAPAGEVRMAYETTQRGTKRFTGWELIQGGRNRLTYSILTSGGLTP